MKCGMLTCSIDKLHIPTIFFAIVIKVRLQQTVIYNL